MPTSMKSRVLVLSLIVLSLHVVSPKARIFQENSISGKKMNRELRFGEIINNVRKFEYHNHERSMLGRMLKRMSPAGPDPEHH